MAKIQPHEFAVVAMIDGKWHALATYAAARECVVARDADYPGASIAIKDHHGWYVRP